MKILTKIKEKLLGYRATNETYITYLRKIGVEIGEDVKLFRPMNTTIDIQNPHLLKIGNHVMITGPVAILTHDYSWSVIKRKYGIIVGNQKKTIIGDNVFIGWGSTILAGSDIGDNTIIGANSVISGKIQGDSVYAGNPARRIMSLEEYYEKRLNKQLGEAVEYVKAYKNRYGQDPKLEELDEYFCLFFDGKNNKYKQKFDFKLKLMDNYEDTMETLKNRKPRFSKYEEFLKYCNKK